VRLHRPLQPQSTPAPALLWIHGGGYIIGNPTQDDRLCRRFAKELGITVAAVKYRLAPENPYPASLEDCYSALTWLATLPAVDRSRFRIRQCAESCRDLSDCNRLSRWLGSQILQ